MYNSWQHFAPNHVHSTSSYTIENQTTPLQTHLNLHQFS